MTHTTTATRLSKVSPLHFTFWCPKILGTTHFIEISLPVACHRKLGCDTGFIQKGLKLRVIQLYSSQVKYNRHCIIRLVPVTNLSVLFCISRFCFQISLQTSNLKRFIGTHCRQKVIYVSA